MRRTLLAVALACAMPIVLAIPANPAVPPERSTIPFGGVIEGHVEACDLNLRWDVNGSIDRTTFFDADGDVVRTLDKVTELNTITNVDDGTTLQEGPDAFVQKTTFNDDGTRILDIAGLSVSVLGGVNPVVDAGRLVLLLGPEPEVLHMSGRHDIRSIDPFTTSDPKLLAGFCPAFV